MDWAAFATALQPHTKATSVQQGDILFGAGLNLSSIRFTEFIMTLEEDLGIDIDIDDLDAKIQTAGQLYARLFPAAT